MSKFRVTGTMRVNWSVEVEADDEDDALSVAHDWVYDGDYETVSVEKIDPRNVVPTEATS
jgi:hypothetical protein